MKSINQGDVNLCICKLTDTLSENVRHISGAVGWHQHLGTNKIGIVATALALLHYKEIHANCPDVEGALYYIRSMQNSDGGWPYISNTNGESNVESTCWAIQALSSSDSEDDNGLIEKGVDWLLSQFNEKRIEDEGWPFKKGSVSRVYLTCLVLRTFVKLKVIDREEIESAKKWLINARNDDGGWGELAAKGSSVFFTSYVISTLIAYGVSKSDLIIQKAFSLLRSKTESIDIEDPSLLCYLEFIESGQGNSRVRIPFFHYVLPHVIIAYIDMGVKNNFVFEGVKVLLQKSKDGVIEHPMLENSRILPIWAFTDTASALSRFRKSFSKWDEEYEFFVVFKSISGFGFKNPLRFLLRVPNAFYGFLLMTLFVFGCFWLLFNYYSENKDTLEEWWDSLTVDTSGQFTISFLASVSFSLLTLVIALGKYLIRWLLRLVV